MSVQRAKFQVRSAWLGTEFGEQYARRLFGDSVVDALPRYVRGKSVGKLKADVTWLKCVEGGWVSAGRDAMRDESYGRVERRVGQVVLAVLRNKEGAEVAMHGDAAYLSMIDSI